MLERRLILPHLIAHRAEREPERVFLQHVDGSTMTFGELHARALRWAGALHAAGVRAGDTVLTMQPTGFEAVAVWLGAAWLRAIEVPANTAYRGRMLSYVVDDSAAQVLVVDGRYLGRFAELDGPLPFHTAIVTGGGSPSDLAGVPNLLTANHALQAPEPEDLAGPGASDVATIMYTSGTTGASKGVLVPWAQAHATVTGTVPIADYDEHDVWYAPYPPFHVTGKAPIYLMALVGGRVVLREVFSTSEFWADVRRFGCTSTVLLGSTAVFLERQPAQPDDADSPLDKLLMTPLPDDVESFKRRFGVRVCTVFNMTEISCPIVSDGWDLHDSRSCGRVRPGYECRVVDEDDSEVPPGELGELVVRSTEPWTLMAGYWGMPDKTVEAWRNLWFHTGDAFTRDVDGNFYFVDRKKDAIRRRGENISSMEVEVEINSHADVLESAVIAVPSEWGEDEVKAVVVPQAGRTIDPDALIEYLTPRMPRFMVPRYVEVVEALPKTPTEKVRKAVLRESGLNASTWDRGAASGAPASR